ncbi:TPA: transporter [Legionella pneumophila]|nr:transporter [Legionella pneumophila]HAU0349900.1 transporter [Legionella pneumophila]HAU0353391.1 transporter [Legionella pneumophila]HAU0359480.1 transporter [Legionella pneumophila]HAU0368037.1 transporter [Legionella pneumophila]
MKPMQCNRKSVWLSLIMSLFIWTIPLGLFANTAEVSKVAIPSTITEIWKAIDEHAASINQALEENQLTSIHEHAFAIRDLVNALPALSKNLSDEQKKTLQNNLSFVAQLATRLDKTGDANDKEGTQANWDKLEKILTQIRALYQTLPSN